MERRARFWWWQQTTSTASCNEIFGEQTKQAAEMLSSGKCIKPEKFEAAHIRDGTKEKIFSVAVLFITLIYLPRGNRFTFKGNNRKRGIICLADILLLSKGELCEGLLWHWREREIVKTTLASKHLNSIIDREILQPQASNEIEILFRFLALAL